MPAPISPPLTADDLIARFAVWLGRELGRAPLTVGAYCSDLHELALFPGPDPMLDAESVTTPRLRAWLASKAEAGALPATLRRKLQAVRTLFRYMRRHGLALTDPTLPIVLPKLRRRLPSFATPAQMERAIAEAADDPGAAFILEMLYSTGLRRAELLSLTDADIDLAEGTLRVTGKRSKTRIIPLPAALCGKIRRWQQERDAANPDLHAPRPLLAYRNRPLQAGRLYATVRRALAATNIRRPSPHALRHTFATALLNGGADLNSVKELLGHASLAATQIYTHVSIAQMRETYLKAHPRGQGAESDPLEKK